MGGVGVPVAGFGFEELHLFFEYVEEVFFLLFGNVSLDLRYLTQVWYFIYQVEDLDYKRFFVCVYFRFPKIGN